jgi:hypothetical protein
MIAVPMMLVVMMVVVVVVMFVMVIVVLIVRLVVGFWSARHRVRPALFGVCGLRFRRRFGGTRFMRLVRFGFGFGFRAVGLAAGMLWGRMGSFRVR